MKNMHEGCCEDDSGMKSTSTSVKKQVQVLTSDIKTYTLLTPVLGDGEVLWAGSPAPVSVIEPVSRGKEKDRTEFPTSFSSFHTCTHRPGYICTHHINRNHTHSPPHPGVEY